MMTGITVAKDQTGEFVIAFQTRDREIFALLVSTIKSFIPPVFRAYVPEKKRWTVAAEAAAELDNWLDYCRHSLGAIVTRLDQHAGGGQQQWWTPPRIRRQPSKDELFARLYLLPSAPPQLVKAAYRELAKLNHPDKGGDEEAMKLLNEAYAKLAA